MRRLDTIPCAAQYKHYGLGTTIWSPLAYGLLSGKYGQGNIPEGSRFAMESYKVMRHAGCIGDHHSLFLSACAQAVCSCHRVLNRPRVDAAPKITFCVFICDVHLRRWTTLCASHRPQCALEVM